MVRHGSYGGCRRRLQYDFDWTTPLYSLLYTCKCCFQYSRLAHHLRRTKAAIAFQTHWRRHWARSQYLRLQHATLVIQSHYRGRQARLLKKQLLYEAKAIVIQRAVRAFLGRRWFVDVRKKVVLLQCCVRRLKAKKELKKLKVCVRVYL